MFRVGEVARVRALYKQGKVGVIPNAAVTVDYLARLGMAAHASTPGAGRPSRLRSPRTSRHAPS